MKKFMLRFVAAQLSVGLFVSSISVSATPARPAPHCSPWGIILAARAADTDGLLETLLERFTPQGSLVTSFPNPAPDEISYHDFHWTRDSAITVITILKALARESNPHVVNQAWSRLASFFSFSRKIQLNHNRSGTPHCTGLGDPRCYLDGSPDFSPWAFPQNDGPALRAVAGVLYASFLLNRGQKALVRETLYGNTLPSQTVIKSDLEYVAHHWRKPCYDIWEESFGLHFFTLMVQRKALWEGSKLARLLNDRGASEFYRRQALEIEKVLERHWDREQNFLRATVDISGGVDYKTSGADVSVILGVTLGEIEGRAFSPADPRVVATAEKLSQTFAALYPINQTLVDAEGRPLAPAIGRYAEDRYDAGNPNGRGNPWVLTTAVFAQYYARLAHLRHDDTLRELANRYLRRIEFHFPEGQRNFSEQFHRVTGHPHGAPSLTWSFSSLLSAKLELAPK